MLPEEFFCLPCRPPPVSTLLCALCGFPQHTGSHPGFCWIRPTTGKAGDKSIRGEGGQVRYFLPCQGTWVLSFSPATALSYSRAALGDCGHCSFYCLSSPNTGDPVIVLNNTGLLVPETLLPSWANPLPCHYWACAFWDLQGLEWNTLETKH